MRSFYTHFVTNAEEINNRSYKLRKIQQCPRTISLCCYVISVTVTSTF